MTDYKFLLALIRSQGRGRAHLDTAGIATLQPLNQSFWDTAPVDAAIAIYHDPTIVMAYTRRLNGLGLGGGQMHFERLRYSFIETVPNTIHCGDANIPICAGHEGNPANIADIGIDAAISCELAERGDPAFRDIVKCLCG